MAASGALNLAISLNIDPNPSHTALPSQSCRASHCLVGQGAVAQSAERERRVREIERSVSGRVKPMIYQIDTYRYLAWRLALIG